MKTAEIHDLGYKRYDGPRRAASTRWQVIMRHQIAYAWKTWWRYKLPLALAMITTVVFAALLYFLGSDTVKAFDRDNKIAIRVADILLMSALVFYTLCGFVSTMTMSAGTVSGDLKSGAFTFYFVRSTRPQDYVIGRFVGLVVLMAPLVFAGPVLLALMRLGLTPENDSLANSAAVVPKMALVGALATIAYASIPFGFSALGNNKGLTIGLFAIHYFVITSIFTLAAMGTTDSLAAFDFPVAIRQLAAHLMDLPLTQGGGAHNNGPKPPDLSIVAAVVGLLLQSALGLGFVMFKLKKQQRDVGGSS